MTKQTQGRLYTLLTAQAKMSANAQVLAKLAATIVTGRSKAKPDDRIALTNTKA